MGFVDRILSLHLYTRIIDACMYGMYNTQYNRYLIHHCLIETGHSQSFVDIISDFTKALGPSSGLHGPSGVISEARDRPKSTIGATSNWPDRKQPHHGRVSAGMPRFLDQKLNPKGLSSAAEGF
jgi:hypothetical protein